MIQQAIYKAINGENLDFALTKSAMLQIMNGKASNAQIAGFLAAMRMKGETIEEITACATVMREKCVKLSPSTDVLDIVGTGGDEANTFNISTVASFIIAACGIPVAKHGNRSVSSKCGSADCLEALGVKLDLTAAQSEKILQMINICFLFAPTYHSSMKYAAPVRKELGVRTIFNILGPLANPAGANMQLLGVYDENLVAPLAQVLVNLGLKHGAVVHGHDGLDEITLCDTTTICEINNGKINSFFLSPEQLGLKRCQPAELVGGSPKENAAIAQAILNGEPGAKRDVVVLNAAVCLYMKNNQKTLRECVKIVQNSIDSGQALAKLNELIRLSNEV